MAAGERQDTAPGAITDQAPAPGDAAWMAELRQRFDQAEKAEFLNREQALDDLKFLAGEQWPQEALQQRRGGEGKSGRPCLTISRLPQFVRQVTGDIRLNRPSIKVKPFDGKTDPALAEVMGGIIRHVEARSDAGRVYALAAESAARCGEGAFRIKTEYVDDESFDLDIKIEHIPWFGSVYWDPNATALTREDADWCFVVDYLTRDSFRARFPEAQVVEFDRTRQMPLMTTWFGDDKIQIAEYWEKSYQNRTLHQLDNGMVIPEGAPPPPGARVQRSRVARVATVKQYLVSGHEVLEGPTEWPGKNIPIIPVWGDEIQLEGQRTRFGVIRFAKDAQRTYNYMRSAAVEAIALAPKAPFILAEEQVKGHEKVWNKANIENYPYLPYKNVPNAPPPQRQQPPAIQSAFSEQAAQAADDMKAATGIYDAALGARSNETSGVAIQARQKEGDISTYVYVDNLAAAITMAGRQLVDLIPKIYDTERQLRILGDDGAASFVTVNRQALDQNGQFLIENELGAGRYDVVVETGPSFSTRRQEAATAMQELLRSAPQLFDIAGDLLVKAMDWPQADELAKRLRKIAIGRGIVEPEEGDEPPKPPAPPPPDPRAEAMARKDMAMAEKLEEETEGLRLENSAAARQLMGQAQELNELLQHYATQEIGELQQGEEQPEPGEGLAVPPPGLPPQEPPPGAPLPPEAQQEAPPPAG